MVDLVERRTALSPAQLARWLEHIVDDGSEEASFQLALFKVDATMRNPLMVDRLLRQLHGDCHPKAALQLGLLLHTLQDGPDGDRAVIKLFTHASARGDTDAIKNCAVFHALGVGVAKNVALAFALFRTLGFYVLPTAHVLPVRTVSSSPAFLLQPEQGLLEYEFTFDSPFSFFYPECLGFDSPNPAIFISFLMLRFSRFSVDFEVFRHPYSSNASFKFECVPILTASKTFLFSQVCAFFK